MPKIVDYPLAPFDKVLELAHTVDYLGGSCSIQDSATQLKKKVSGGFGILISSAIKHDLVVRRHDRLSTSDLYRKIKLSYNTAEKIDFQRISFLHPGLYRKIYDRFKNQELPYSMLDKLLIREFQVDENVSVKIAGFFLEGLRRLQLLKDGKLCSIDKLPQHIAEEKQLPIPLVYTSVADQPPVKPDKGEEMNKPSIRDQNGTDKFVVTIKGTGMDTSMTINDAEDFKIIEAILGKIKKSFAQ